MASLALRRSVVLPFCGFSNGCLQSFNILSICIPRAGLAMSRVSLFFWDPNCVLPGLARGEVWPIRELTFCTLC
ncbi:MAG TPA: hypothetical protein VHS80_07415, partial [Chthoniobacterales bacterium]|nr:hypothetical protein [Chthoniobacterales bacterium]